MKPSYLKLFAGAATALLLSSGPARTEAAPLPDVPPQVDILFVIDNSGSMAEEQARLAAEFPVFLSTLTDKLGEQPDLHIGVVSSNVGAGGFVVPMCTGEGDNGALQHAATVEGCTPPNDAWITDVAGAEGTRVQNYSGTLADTFSCVAHLGTMGCGFEQHLESMKRALDDSQPGNAGFLRRDANLAVIILADEDDCSASDPRVFSQAISDEAELGPLTSFRCTEFGVTCAEGAIGRAPGTYTDCVARTDSPFIRDPREYAEFLRGLKPDGDKLFAAAIIGPSGPFTTSISEINGKPQLDFSCIDGQNGGATPAVRLEGFLKEFPLRSTQGSSCQGGETGLAAIASALAAQLNGTAPPLPGPEKGGGCQIGAGLGRGSAPMGGVAIALGLLGLGWLARRRRA